MDMPDIKLSQRHVDVNVLDDIIEQVWDNLSEADQEKVLTILDNYDVVYEV